VQLILLLSLMCQTPAVPVSDAIHFWPEVKAPTPIPVSPDAATVLHAGDTAIFDANVEMFFRVIPDGVVKVKRVNGPKSYFYTDDKGEVVEKDFAGKFLLVLTPAKSGTCQIVIVPKGVVDDKKITTRLIECQLAPKPPPPSNGIPNVLGLPQVNARSVIADAKFTVGAVTQEANAAQAGNVFRQDPLPGTSQPDGYPVSLWVSLGNSPAPEPPPISQPGLHVLIVYESGDVNASVATITRSMMIREYLDAKCPTEADGKMKAYRIWDANVDAKNDLAVWQDAFKRPRKSIPWIVVSNGKTGFEGPLPTTVAATMDLLKKFGD